MKSEIGDLIGKSRSDMGLTQDQFGKKYNVSGPAIFKFEKNYVKPSLDLWLSMAKDMKIKEQTAVLMWIRGKLPKKFQNFVDLEPATAKEKGKGYKTKATAAKKFKNAAEARKAILADRTAPKGLKALLRDDDVWALYKPTAKEMQLLKDTFGTLGAGNKATFREALLLVRDFQRL